MSKALKHKAHKRLRRKARVRAIVTGSAARPRLSVFRSATHIYAQIIDDARGTTLAHASSLKLPAGKTKKADIAKAVGQQIAKAAKAKGIEKVAFDRNGYAYHGRVKALADGAREGGLAF